MSFNNTELPILKDARVSKDSVEPVMSAMKLQMALDGFVEEIKSLQSDLGRGILSAEQVGIRLRAKSINLGTIACMPFRKEPVCTCGTTEVDNATPDKLKHARGCARYHSCGPGCFRHFGV